MCSCTGLCECDYLSGLGSCPPRHGAHHTIAVLPKEGAACLIIIHKLLRMDDGLRAHIVAFCDPLVEQKDAAAEAGAREALREIRSAIPSKL